ncbi:hypothetical protein CPLU01_09509 [Colletotrichum plurivorum]|uniref:Uncharacterized protein n=1 Tax=Colletotrichum plurivorum TaxID=2175906 RepID=A0A8H6K8M0_9PEZI|nr:hypothetical protein CPLU01_09509 [Colletotrichum plurivorum]
MAPEDWQGFPTDFPKITSQIRRPSSESYRWGFYLYRATYNDQLLWERYIAYIREEASKTLDYEDNRDQLKKHFRLTIIEDPSLDEASVEEVQERFRTWVAALPEEGDEEQEIPAFDRRDQGRFDYCLYVDVECLQSFEIPSETEEEPGETESPVSAFVKVINAERHWPDPEEEAYSDEEEDSEEDCEEEQGPEYYWILLSCNDICSFYSTITVGCEWDRQYRLCSYPEKRPWESC